MWCHHISLQDKSASKGGASSADDATASRVKCVGGVNSAECGKITCNKVKEVSGYAFLHLSEEKENYEPPPSVISQQREACKLCLKDFASMVSCDPKNI